MMQPVHSPSLPMELIQVTADEMAAYFPKPSHIYNSVPFAELNSCKCREVAYLLFRDTRVRGGLILGMDEEMARTPFSAPFGGLLLSRSQSVGAIGDMYCLARNFARGRGLKLRVTLPPAFIDDIAYAKSVNVLSRLSEGNITADINYHVDLRSITDPELICSRSARKNLHQAQSHPFGFEQLEVTPDNIAKVYEVIHCNRLHRGFPHRMTLDQVIATSEIVPMELFMLYLGGEPAAAAQIQRLNDNVAQVVYWGDMPQHQWARPMNLLPIELYRHYIESTSIRFLDIGPSTENGIPNRGLCDFKETIGCIPTVKPTFII